MRVSYISIPPFMLVKAWLYIVCYEVFVLRNMFDAKSRLPVFTLSL